MTPESWADDGIGADVPLKGPPILDEAEAFALIRFAYVSGYLDALKGENEILDPCSAERALTLTLPIG
jgi:hypothetical protein